MNHPYPTARELRTEAAAERLLAEQAEAEVAFRHIVNIAHDAIAKLHFPLCGPAYRYETADVLSQLGEFLISPDGTTWRCWPWTWPATRWRGCDERDHHHRAGRRRRGPLAAQYRGDGGP